jgi:hypothetical protein
MKTFSFAVQGERLQFILELYNLCSLLDVESGDKGMANQVVTRMLMEKLNEFGQDVPTFTCRTNKKHHASNVERGETCTRYQDARVSS